MLTFAHDLLEQGRVVVPLMNDASAPASTELETLIRRFDAEQRLELPFSAPPLAIPAAVWALGYLQNACRFLVYRELDEAVMSAALQGDCPVPTSPACSYSVDLFLRYLPDVARMAKGIGTDDPLVKHLQETAARWPLSSVGMTSVVCDVASLKPILSDRCLMRLYVDRIIERGDVSRLNVPETREAAAAALGAHPSLAPQISSTITKVLEQT